MDTALLVQLVAWLGEADFWLVFFPFWFYFSSHTHFSLSRSFALGTDGVQGCLSRKPKQGQLRGKVVSEDGRVIIC